MSRRTGDRRNTPNRGKDSFVPRVDLKNKNHQCSLKRHFRNAAREVVGYLDLLASKNDQRFVWAGVADITKHCNKYRKDKRPYKQRTIEDVLEFLREQGVMTQSVNGKQGGGFNMLDHASLAARRLDNPYVCEWIGFPKLDPTSKGRRVTRVVFGANSLPKSADAARTTARTEASTARTDETQLRGRCADENQKMRGRLRGQLRGREALQSSETAKLSGLEDHGLRKPCGTFADSSLEAESVNREKTTGVALEPTECGQENEDGNGQGKAGRAGASSSRLTDQEQYLGALPQTPRGICIAHPATPASSVTTVRQHFEEIFSTDQTQALALISDGEIDKKEWDKYSVRFGYWPELVTCCRESVNERSDQPYLGRKTNGDLMATAMVRLKEKTGQRTPEFWYPVIKKLRAGGPSLIQPEPTTSAVEAGPAAWNPNRCLRLGDTFREAALSAEIDISPFHDLLDWAAGDSGWRGAWHFLAEQPNLPEPLQRLRDWLFESDSMWDKPAVAPWKSPEPT